jgi:hypothetical protein
MREMKFEKNLKESQEQTQKQVGANQRRFLEYEEGDIATTSCSHLRHSPAERRTASSHASGKLQRAKWK